MTHTYIALFLFRNFITKYNIENTRGLKLINVIHYCHNDVVNLIICKWVTVSSLKVLMSSIGFKHFFKQIFFYHKRLKYYCKQMSFEHQTKLLLMSLNIYFKCRYDFKIISRFVTKRGSFNLNHKQIIIIRQNLLIIIQQNL